MSLEIERDNWNKRYSRGENSGSGSYGEEGKFKAQQVIDFADKDIETILDVGCGDLNIAQQIVNHFPKAQYLGLDPSDYIIRQNKSFNLGDKWDFKLIDTGEFNFPSDLVLCLDVLYHIIDKDEYEKTLESLKKSWKKYLAIVTHPVKEDQERNGDLLVRKFNPEYFSKDYKVIPMVLNPQSVYLFKKV